METMSDGAIGELWRGYSKVVSVQGDHVRLLICKLVEERAQRYQRHETDGEAEALHDFGITSAEWEHPNG